MQQLMTKVKLTRTGGSSRSQVSIDFDFPFEFPLISFEIQSRRRNAAADATCLSRRMPNASQACPYTLSILPSFRMRRALLAVGSETGHANKSSASRIRRRSRRHLAEASALDGPMKDRLDRDGLLRW
jgi:hypothetical protein